MNKYIIFYTSNIADFSDIKLEVDKKKQKVKISSGGSRARHVNYLFKWMGKKGEKRMRINVQHVV